MNIREHIEAGHYERDAAGRPTVTLSGGRVATVAITNKPGAYPLVGWIDGWDTPEAWTAEGQYYRRDQPSAYNLLPPPPHKVEVRAYAVLLSPVNDRRVGGVWLNEQDAVDFENDVAGRQLIHLIGSYDEPWIK